MRTINENGIELIKSFEGCKLKAYQDGGGVWTIGYGHTKGVKEGDIISSNIATTLLMADLTDAELEVCKYIKAELTDNQFAALVSLVFNAGNAPLLKTLGRLLNSGDYEGAAAQFLRWNKDNFVAVAGLTRRRAAEKALFEKED